MITKHFAVAASMMAFIALSGEAYAGTTISDTRYWPSEVNSTDQNTVQRAESAFYSAESSRGTEATRQSYQGGPKGNY